MMLLYNRKLFPELFWLPKRFRSAKAVNIFTDFPSSFACTRNRFGKPSPVKSMSILAVYASVQEHRFFDIQPELAELTYSVCRFDIATFTSSRRNAGCPFISFIEYPSNLVFRNGTPISIHARSLCVSAN
jgi:hypothetical protein